MKLIILNGPCGVGKSTIAPRIHEGHPLSFLLDIDAQCRFISHYREYDKERWEMVRAISMGIIEACLKVGKTVIVDKMTFDPEILDTYHALGERYGAHVHEIILWAPKETVLARAHARGWKEGGLLTPEKCERFWEEIDQLKDKRPNATIIDVSELTEEELATRLQEVTE